MSFVQLFRSAANVPVRSVGRRAVPTTTIPMLLRRWLSDEARATIDSAVKAHPLVLFMKGTPDAPQCGFSRAVIQTLDLHGVSPSKMHTYNVLADPDLRSGIKEYSEWPTVPQLYVNGEFVGGCDIVMSLHQNGELQTLLEKGNVIANKPYANSS